jgi:hypothetical protein
VTKKQFLLVLLVGAINGMLLGLILGMLYTWNIYN